MSENKYKAILLDMDGLLVDSERITFGMWVEIFQRHGHKLDLDHYVQLCGKNEEAVIEALDAMYPGLSLHEHIWPEWDGKYEILAPNGGVPLKKGALQLMDYCDEHRIKMAICSSNLEHWVTAILNGDGVYDRFWPVLDGSCVGRSKPAPDLFLRAAELLKLEPHECLVMEDSNSGITAGHRAGMDVLCVPDLMPPTADCMKMCTYICDDLAQAIQYL